MANCSLVTNYEFLNGEHELVPFSVLTHIEKSPISDQIYLRGKSGDGLRNVVEPVMAWKLDVSQINGPESFVSSKNGAWIKLLKPRKIYEGVIRSILITIHMLHFLKWNSNSDEKNLWDHLRKAFDKFEGRPSKDDLIPHLSFIKEFSEQDEILSNSPFLKDFIERNSASTTGQDENDSFDNVCCICDNGGELLCCEGNCMRSFHADKKAGEESNCKSLGFSKSQFDEITNFLCKNCELKQHQCFLCGKLGNSDKNNNPQVFQCGNTTCGYFYHAKCISKELCKDDEIQAQKCEKYISQNGKFICTYHKCSVCKEKEQKDDFALQFAVCRRCPKSYHRKCLPWEIAFEGEGRITRAWDDLLPNNRILVYCMKHKIDKDLGTPLRNQIKFPVEKENKIKKEKEKEKGKGKEKEKEKEQKKEKENSSSKRKRENEDPDYSPSLKINKIRIFENKKIQNCENNSKRKEKSPSANKDVNKLKRREIKNKEREIRKQERESKKAERENRKEAIENKMEEIENKKEDKENKTEESENKMEEIENKKEDKENKMEETENKTEETESKNEEGENKKEEGENKRNFHEERESEAKRICTGLKNKDTEEPIETCHVYVKKAGTSEAQKSCTDVINTVQNQEPMETRQVYKLPAVQLASTSGSVTDRYAPKLEEVNLGRLGPPFNLGVEGFWPVYCYDMSGVLRRDLPPYKGPPPGSTCGWISD